MTQLIKRKKPVFFRQDTAKKKRLTKKWRKPRGLQSKMRLNKKGRKISPSVGWRSPVATRGKTKDGKVVLVVSNKGELESAKEGVTILISRKTGQRKKVELITLAKEKGMDIAHKNVDKYLASVKEEMEKRKKKTKKVIVEKKAPASKEQSKEKTSTASDDEKKAKEKQDKDKVLTKRDVQ